MDKAGVKKPLFTFSGVPSTHILNVHVTTSFRQANMNGNPLLLSFYCPAPPADPLRKPVFVRHKNRRGSAATGSLAAQSTSFEMVQADASYPPIFSKTRLRTPVLILSVGASHEPV